MSTARIGTPRATALSLCALSLCALSLCALSLCALSLCALGLGLAALSAIARAEEAEPTARGRWTRATDRRLLYQDPAYLRTQLIAYRDGGRGGPGSAPLAMAMASVVTEVDDDAIDQLVAHIGSLRPERPALDNPEVTVSDEEGLAAFADIYTVAQHPRCLNCRPAGDSPLQGDDSTPSWWSASRPGGRLEAPAPSRSD